MFMDCFLPFELIDTLWNVNVTGLFPSWTESLELIDTLWNVNSSMCQIPVWQMVN